MHLSGALKKKRLFFGQRHDNVILKNDSERPHISKRIKTYLETFKWEVVTQPPYSPDIALSNHYLFISMAQGLVELHFHSYENTKNVRLVISCKRPVFPTWNSNASQKDGKNLWLAMENSFSDMFTANFFK